MWLDVDAIDYDVEWDSSSIFTYFRSKEKNINGHEIGGRTHPKGIEFVFS